MDWTKQNQAVIQCQEKVVVLTTPNGDRISVDVVVQKQPTATVNQLDDSANKEDPVVDEFPDVFPDDLPGMDAAAAGRGVVVPSQLLATARPKCLSC